MLVLSRRVNESIIVVTPNNERIELSFNSINGNTVRVGIEAPSEYQIYRNEVSPPVNLPEFNPLQHEQTK